MTARCKECGGKLVLHELRTEELVYEIEDDGSYRERDTGKQAEYWHTVECEKECEDPGWWFNRIAGVVTQNRAEGW